jgi:hypothetical protein
MTSEERSARRAELERQRRRANREVQELLARLQVQLHRKHAAELELRAIRIANCAEED